MEDKSEKSSRNIPLPIQREVRQRCGFGCVICGFPIFEYDHMTGWANVHEHIADDITLLCDKHHKEVTIGLLPREKVIEANKRPYNIVSKVSSELPLHYEGKYAEVHLGGNSFTTFGGDNYSESIPLIIDGIPIIAFILQDNQLLLNVNIFNENNEVVLRIVNNQLYYAAMPWDIEFKGTRLVLREKLGKYLISIKFEPPNKVTFEKGRFLCNGVEVLLYKDSILITNNNIAIRGSHASNTHCGLIIGRCEYNSGFFKIEGVPRYFKNSKESIKWFEEFENIE